MVTKRIQIGSSYLGVQGPMPENPTSVQIYCTMRLRQNTNGPGERWFPILLVDVAN
jgi:hypothetical protein